MQKAHKTQTIEEQACEWAGRCHGGVATPSMIQEREKWFSSLDKESNNRAHDAYMAEMKRLDGQL